LLWIIKTIPMTDMSIIFPIPINYSTQFMHCESGKKKKEVAIITRTT
jgi:hypothetical protein